MKIVEHLPHRVEEIENCWIPMPDGMRLAARLWLPDKAAVAPVPAILEYIPYRKRDGTRERDEPMHRYFAGHGYAAVRVDVRGSGDSEGLLLDEYAGRELEDGVAVIQWIASQPWCDGSVGMMGKSWGGFNSLQVAALRPPALKAVISVCSTDDRYADDAHYMGGCLLNENLLWGSVLFTNCAKPPDPEIVGGRWRELWFERLDRLPLFTEIWLQHPLRDEYWRHGSVCENYADIDCPVYLVGGWADGYTNAVPRLLQGLDVPRKALVGPWAHLYPHEGVPRPAIGFLQEALRWWDSWLKGRETGILSEPMYRAWMQDGVRPLSFYDERPGRWVAEGGWPSDHIRAERLHLGRHRLTGKPEETVRLDFRSPETVGLAGGSWCAFGVEGEMPRDQREDDGKSLVFDSDPLDRRLEIWGSPVVTLTVAADRRQGLLAVRLNDVAMDGSSTRITYGLLNLTHRSGHGRFELLEPHEKYVVRLALNHVAHNFAPGHRLRLALSTSYWPIAWPSPEPTTLSVFTEGSGLELPVRDPREEDDRLPPFAEPESGPPPDVTDLHPGGVTRTITRDLATNEVVYTTLTDVDDEGDAALTRVEAIGLEHGHAVIESFRIEEQDPLSARAEIVHKAVHRRGSWSTRIETRTRFWASKKAFRLQADLDAYEGDACVFSRSWDRSIPRAGV